MRRSLLALLPLALPTVLAAQEPVPTPTPKAQVVSVNPLALVFAGISGEYERRAGEATAVALGLSYWPDDDIDYVSADAKFRFYPSGEALRGFSVAGTAGYTHVAADVFCVLDCDEDEGDAIAAGVELNYQWLLGRTRNFALTVGVGAKRLFFVGGDVEGASLGLPTARFSIGYAF